MANLVLAPNKSGSNLVLAPTQSSAAADTTAPVMTGSITVSAITSSGFTLSWPAATDNVAVTGYEVSINGSGLYTDVGNVLTISETGLTASTAYSVLVRAYDVALNKATPLSTTATTSAAASIVTSVTVSPSSATGSQQFTATVVGTNSPSQTVTWTLSPTITGSSVSSTGYYTAPAQTASVQSQTITATSAQDGTKSGTATVSIAATSADTTAPTFTGSLVQTAVTSTSCTIDWSGTTHTDNIGITGYEYNINSGIYYAIGNVLAYVFTGFAAATSYTIGIRAFDAAGNRSAVLSITTTTLAIGVTPGPTTPSTLYLQDFFQVTMGDPSTNACLRSPCIALIVGEYGVQFNINVQYDLSAATTLSLKFTRPDATTFTVVPVMGSVPLITPLGTFAANQYVTYITTLTDFIADGGHQMRLTYTDGYKRVLSPVINFAVSP